MTTTPAKPLTATRALLLGALGATAAVALFVGLDLHPAASDAQTVAPAVTRVAPADPGQIQLSYAPVVKRAAPAVVNIFAAKLVATGPRTMEEYLRQQFSGVAPPPRVARSLGSGVIVDADGLIVTNSHVVGDATDILVSLADRREYPAKIVFSDPRTDLAVLRIDTKGVPLPTVELADSDAVEVGDIVLAIGDPFGIGQTVTHGIISALARNGLGASDRQFFLQTDAAINPGNSGGALLDMRGRLIGINTMIASQTGNSVGIGFAIPAAATQDVIASLKDKGEVTRGWLGVQIQPVNEDFAEALGIAENSGEFIQSVQPGQAAADAGLQSGDVVLSVNGEDITRDRSLSYIVANIRPGTRVPVVYMRDGERQRTTVTVGRRPSEDELRAQAETFDPDQEGADQLDPGKDSGVIEQALGVQVIPITPVIARQLGAGADVTGVVVTAVDPNSDAARKGLTRGVVIHSANGRTVTTAEELEAQIRAVQASDREAIMLRVSARGQAEASVPVRLRDVE